MLTSPTSAAFAGIADGEPIAACFVELRSGCRARELRLNQFLRPTLAPVRVEIRQLERRGQASQVVVPLRVDGVGELRWGTSRRTRFYVLVKRDDPRFPPGDPQKFSATDFDVEWTTSLTILYGLKGGRPGTELRLFCSDETDGFLGSEAGADDIKVALKIDVVNATKVVSVTR